MTKKIFIFSLLFSLTSCVGFGVSGMPPLLSSDQLDKIKDKHYDCVIGVKKYEYPVYSESLLINLKSTGIFKDVVLIEEKSNIQYDVIAEVKKAVYGSTAIPIFTLLTFGIIPMTVDEDHGDIFSLKLLKKQNEEKNIISHYVAPTTLGWYALILWPLSKYTDSDPEETKEYRDYLIYKIVSESDEMLTNCKNK